MKVFQKVQKNVEVVADVTCNRCGNSCRNAHLGQGFDFISLDFKDTGSYGSQFEELVSLFDGRIHLCDSCCIAVLSQFRFLPATPGFDLTPTADGTWK